MNRHEPVASHPSADNVATFIKISQAPVPSPHETMYLASLKIYSTHSMRKILLGLLGVLPLMLWSQATQFSLENFPLKDLSAFKSVKSNWQIVGDVSGDLNKDYVLKTKPGADILVNLPDDKNKDNLVFNMEHGDLDLELDLMMAKHSNSGIYLQGRYELQLLDSWGKRYATKGDLGGMYERWDDSRGKGREGFEGTPPRVNVARAPGLWQRLRIEFQAPRFNAAGKKIANARIIRAMLNGVVIHENLELTGPTRGGGGSEAPLGPILIQGDHGPVAFRNIRYRKYDLQTPTISNVKYRTFGYEQSGIPADFSKLMLNESGELNALTWEVAAGDNDFVNHYTGKLHVPTAGKYNITLLAQGFGNLKIGGQWVFPTGSDWARTKMLDLPAGTADFELAYSKHATWYQPLLSLVVEGANCRPTPLHMPSSAATANPVAPILLNPGTEPELTRCFIDVPAVNGAPAKRVVHALSVGHPADVHYTIDLDCGTWIQAWRGGYFDATPMWENRGDGHADPLGAPVVLGTAPQIGPAEGAWPDTLSPAAGYRLTGYQVDGEGLPTFQYKMYGTEVQDKIVPADGGKTLRRTLTVNGTSTTPLRFCVARGKKIEQMSPDTWAVDDKQYYVQLPAKSAPQIRTVGTMQELVVPLGTGVEYTVVW